MPGPGLVDVALTGDPRVDDLLVGQAWASDELTFSFPSALSEYDDDAPERDSIASLSALSAPWRAAFRADLSAPGAGGAYGTYASVSNLRFTEATGGAGVLREAFSTDVDIAYSYYPSLKGRGGDSFLHAGYMAAYPAPAPGDYAWLTALHELGHALGLKHGQDADGITGQAVPDAYDDVEFTVMTYHSYVGAVGSNYSNEDWAIRPR